MARYASLKSAITSSSLPAARWAVADFSSLLGSLWKKLNMSALVKLICPPVD